jgi:uncharacterized membrane protein YoaK (UPF0700 family)
MNETPRSAIAALMMLTFVTGLVDAASVLGLGHVFTANMTGNIVFLGFALAGSGTVSVLASLIALASFMVGALVGGRVTKVLSAAAVRVAFGIEVAILGLATALCILHLESTTNAIVSLLALSMGLRNAVIRKLAIPDMTTTVLTLTVTGLAADSSLAGGKNPRWQRRVLAILVMLAGAALGAGGLAHGLAWVVGAATVIEAVAVIMLGTRAEGFAPAAVPTVSPSRAAP